jgi:hypothetical protein
VLSAIVGTISVFTASIADAPISRAKSPVQLAVEARQWDVAGVRDYLDALALDDLRDVLGEPEIVTTYAQAPGWNSGDGRPELADENPAVQQALAYCAANRARQRLRHRAASEFDTALGPVVGGIHPVPCVWCSEPEDKLWEAVSWAVYTSRYVVAEFAIWLGASGHAAYRRSTGRGGEYENPKHRLFWGQPQKDRRWELDQVLKSARSQVSA